MKKLVRNMELPIAPVGRIIKNAGAQRVSYGAEYELARILELYGDEIVKRAISLGKHSGRKTVKASDINLVVNNIKNITNIINSQVVTDSNNVKLDINGSFNIENSFNDLDRLSEGYENADEIKENLRSIKYELSKDQIDQSKFKSSVDWLKRNANWIIPSISQIVLASMGLKC